MKRAKTNTLYFKQRRQKEQILIPVHTFVLHNQKVIWSPDLSQVENISNYRVGETEPLAVIGWHCGWKYINDEYHIFTVAIMNNYFDEIPQINFSFLYCIFVSSTFTALC